MSHNTIYAFELSNTVHIRKFKKNLVKGWSTRAQHKKKRTRTIFNIRPRMMLKKNFQIFSRIPVQ